ncbi:MAG: NADH-quinone oxidoreductase subunit J [Neisseriaceae bacterium]
MLTSTLFYIFAFILVFSGLRVITAKNPIHSVLFLILAFITSACLWMMLNAEFLSLALIVIYVGAVMILFLFVVMMLDIDVEAMRKGFWKNLPLALLLGIIVLVEMLLVIINKPMIIENSNISDTNIANANKLGWILYTQYSYPVELASMILLLGLVAAVALTLRNSEKNAKYQNIRKQLNINAKDRFELVKMKSEVESEEIKQDGVNK